MAEKAEGSLFISVILRILYGHYTQCSEYEITSSSPFKEHQRSNSGEGKSQSMTVMYLLLHQELSVLVQLPLQTGQLFVLGSCPVHCEMLNSIPRLHPLDASSIIVPLLH